MTANGVRILVGVDGSQTARHALEWAVEEAQVRGLPLEVVHSWQMVYAVEPMAGAGAMQFSPQQLAADARKCVDSVVESVHVPEGVEVVTTLVEGAAGRSLVEHSAGAAMIVVGRHGHHPILAKLLGSVAEYVVHHAACPVVVVPG